MDDYKLGYICGFLLVLFICAVVAVICKKKNIDNSAEFDERQLLERGNAYKLGFTTFLIEYAAYILFLSFTDGKASVYIEPLALVSIALFIPLTVFCVYAVKHDALMGYNVTNKKFYILYIFACVCNLIPAIMSFVDGSMIENGRLTVHSINLVVAILFGGILLALYVKNKRDKSED